jgi:hypothetical protein
MPNIGVPENNKVTLSKSKTKARHQITHNGRHSLISKIRWIIHEPHISQVNVRCIVPEWVTHRFTKRLTRTHATPIVSKIIGII